MRMGLTLGQSGTPGTAAGSRARRAVHANPCLPPPTPRCCCRLGARAKPPRVAPFRALRRNTECFAGFVNLDNQSDPRHTILRVEADDFAGLIRVLAWTLTGLGLSVTNALIQTNGSVASDVFFVTDTRGRKLGDAAAHDVAERLQSIIDDVCRISSEGEFSEARIGEVILLTNETHPTCTELVVTPELDSPDLLLDLASVIHGMGVTIVEGVIRSAGPVSVGTRHLKVDPIASVPEPPEGKRTMRFMLQEAQSGRQLDYATASGLLYALQLVTGRSTPTQLPSVNLY